jgi:hypothetical protein
MRVNHVATVFVTMAIALALAGCKPTIKRQTQLQGNVGKTVTVEGIARNTILGGPTIDFNGTYVHADRPPQYETIVGKRVRVTGTLVEIPDPLAERTGGPKLVVYKLDNAKWKVVEEKRERERD